MLDARDRPTMTSPLGHRPSEVHAHPKQIDALFSDLSKQFAKGRWDAKELFVSYKAFHPYQAHALYINQSFNQINGLFTYALSSELLPKKRWQLLKKPQRNIAEIVDSAKLTSLWQIELKFAN